MNSKHICLAALALAGVACSPAASLEMANPLHGRGKVANNVIEFPNGATESEFELPAGTLTQSASLVSLTKEEVCFDVKLASLDVRKDLATPEGWRVFLRGEPEFEDKRPQFREMVEVSEKVVPGSVEKQATSTERICDQYGNNCINRNITTTYREPAMLTVLTGGGTVCFANKGHIKKSTEELTLHLDDPKPNFADRKGNIDFFAALTNRVAFRWKFN